MPATVKTKKPRGDYSKGKIYVLRSPLDERVYIGSTVQPAHKRLIAHKTTARTGNKKSLLYNVMRQIGVESYTLDVLEDFSCENKKELEELEYNYIKDLPQELLLNSNTAIRGPNHANWKGGSICHHKQTKGFNVKWSVNGVPDSHFIGYGPRSNRTLEEALQAAEEFKRKLFRDQESEDSD